MFSKTELKSVSSPWLSIPYNRCSEDWFLLGPGAGVGIVVVVRLYISSASSSSTANDKN